MKLKSHNNFHSNTSLMKYPQFPLSRTALVIIILILTISLISQQQPMQEPHVLNPKNTIVLSGRPLYRIKKIELIDLFGALDPYRDSSTGAILFKSRVNNEILLAPVIGDPLQYRVVIKNPGNSQSMISVNTIELGWPAIDLNGLEIEVTYDTIGGFEVVDAYVNDLNNRPTGYNTLTRAYHPIYMNFTVDYKIRTSVDIGESFDFDDTETEKDLIDYINSYFDTEVLDVSVILSKIRELAPNVSTIYPLTIDYSLYLPDGRLINYRTRDRLTILPTTEDQVEILNPSDFGFPTNFYLSLKSLLLSLGVSDNNIRYLATEDSIIFNRRA